MRRVADSRAVAAPKLREDWLNALTDSLLSPAEASHQRVIAAMVSFGISEEDIFESYLPEVAALLGERWVNDQASFVDVAIGSARLQEFIRSRECLRETVRDRLIPLGQSVLLVIPKHEQHGLGAFVAANQFRREGLWAHVAVGLEDHEIVEQIKMRRFSMIGLTVGSHKTLEKTRVLAEYIRSKIDPAPPIVMGGRGVLEGERIAQKAGADVVAGSAREAIERLGLMPVSDQMLTRSTN